MNKVNYFKNDLIPYYKEFGLRFSTRYFMNCLFKNYQQRHNAVKEYIKSESYEADIIAHYETEKVKDFKIWVFWWQGEENMPQIVRICNKYLKINAKNFDIHIITKDNFMHYVNISSHVLRKLREGKMTLTHFSDILRFALLDKYGGLWLDSTILTIDDLSNHPEVYSSSIYTLKFSHKDEDYFNISYGRWSGYLMATNQIHYPLFQLGLKIFNDYWEKHDALIDYFLIDFIIEFLYCNNSIIKRDLDLVPLNNVKHFLLERIMDEPFNQFIYDDITKETFFHKLSRKIPWDYKNENSYLGYIRQHINGE